MVEGNNKCSQTLAYLTDICRLLFQVHWLLDITSAFIVIDLYPRLLPRTHYELWHSHTVVNEEKNNALLVATSTLITASACNRHSGYL